MERRVSGTDQHGTWTEGSRRSSVTILVGRDEQYLLCCRDRDNTKRLRSTHKAPPSVYYDYVDGRTSNLGSCHRSPRGVVGPLTRRSPRSHHEIRTLVSATISLLPLCNRLTVSPSRTPVFTPTTFARFVSFPGPQPPYPRVL